MKKLTIILFSLFIAASSFGQTSITVINNIGCDVEMDLISVPSPACLNGTGNSTSIVSVAGNSQTYNAAPTYTFIHAIHIDPTACIVSSSTSSAIGHSGTSTCNSCTSGPPGTVPVSATYTTNCGGCSSFVLTYDVCAQTITIN
ncbi:MAG: hypothetical protein RJQ00_09140 [Vicingaceae bacterium]